ncbi:MAG: DUF2075 domain-containing protein [Armatimonadetes bacterium]|nr:DUF2075 domain-containing protein [Armatimonadota bacterium]NOG93182.1 DUF2075 domain-containing protein [Armatimonadota bacterium]
MLKRYYYASPISDFLRVPLAEVLGEMAAASGHALLQTQRDAWVAQFKILRDQLTGHQGFVILEYTIPRMGSRVDAILLIGPCCFVVEFKVGATSFDSAAGDQVLDYALDLRYFHEPSHHVPLIPLLIATSTESKSSNHPAVGGDLQPNMIPPDHLGRTIREIVERTQGPAIDPNRWLNGRYSPTPTIVEAATALYRGHSVQEISRSDASGQCLRDTCESISRIIASSKARSDKTICFVTGVPGAGKTLVGLNVANTHSDQTSDLYSVFLSGNGPLVAVLREALARDAVHQARLRGETLRKGEARSRVKQFIQNVHHFRDECLRDLGPPVEHVALFDEAQRAWNRDKTAAFMCRKRNYSDFDASEPEYLISCLDRHRDWATIVCLVGSGQEINTGEAGIGEWLLALSKFRRWRVILSRQIHGLEYRAGDLLAALENQGRVTYNESLHLRASMRSFRAERVSELVRAVLDRDVAAARILLEACQSSFPIFLARDVHRAKEWVRTSARGSERYGLLVSSTAERLRPHGIHVKAPVDPIHWFLDGKDDVRSSYYLEDVATEFHIQGLELDWTCVTWDADFRYSPTGWRNFNFVGSKWNRIRQDAAQRYQVNAYRVLLTRARQGMVIVVPEGNPEDPTRLPEFYDGTYNYLREVGFPIL